MKHSKLRMTVQEAAKLLGASEQFVRIGLQQNIFDWGYAVKTSSYYTYYISAIKLKKALGLED